METFVVLEGKCLATVEDLEIDEEKKEVCVRRKEEITLEQGQSITVYPHKKHTFFSEEKCRILALSSKQFDPENTDTFTTEAMK